MPSSYLKLKTFFLQPTSALKRHVSSRQFTLSSFSSSKKPKYATLVEVCHPMKRERSGESHLYVLFLTQATFQKSLTALKKESVLKMMMEGQHHRGEIIYFPKNFHLHIQ